MEETYLWVEKYRPRKLDDIVLPEERRKIFQQWIKQKDLPHCLFYGCPGSGKSTIAQILVDNLIKNKGDVLYLSGSVHNGVDIIRNLCADFASTPRYSECPKIIYIDEGDYLTPAAQAAFRSISEEFHDNARFIVTGNFFYKFTEAVISRLQCYEFKKLPFEFVQNYIFSVLEKENIKYKKDSVTKIIQMFYPDVRRILNTLQSRTYEGVLSEDINNIEVSEDIILSFINDLFTNLNNDNQGGCLKTINSLISQLNEREINYVSIYERLFFEINTPFWSRIIINDYFDKHTSSCASPSMNFMACVYKIYNMGIAYNKTRKNI